MAEKLTEAQFAQMCTRMASRCAGWAGDMLDGNPDEAVTADLVGQFTDAMRERLDHIDRRAGRRALGEQ